jgi:hypothetical protein
MINGQKHYIDALDAIAMRECDCMGNY